MTIKSTDSPPGYTKENPDHLKPNLKPEGNSSPFDQERRDTYGPTNRESSHAQTKGPEPTGTLDCAQDCVLKQAANPVGGTTTGAGAKGESNSGPEAGGINRPMSGSAQPQEKSDLAGAGMKSAAGGVEGGSNPIDSKAPADKSDGKLDPNGVPSPDELKSKYGNDTPDAVQKYAGLSRAEIEKYRKLDQGFPKGAGPTGDGWDAVVKGPSPENPQGSPAWQAEQELKSRFDALKGDINSTKPMSDAVRTELGGLNHAFFDVLRNEAKNSKNSEELLRQLETLEPIYKKRMEAGYSQSGFGSGAF